MSVRRMPRPLAIVVLGLSLSSAWGNGHATTWRALLRAMAGRGHRVQFLERDVPWYAGHRDLAAPDFCRLDLYPDLASLEGWRPAIAAADAVILGSFVPQGAEVAARLQAWATGVLAFYDIDTPVTLSRLASGNHDYLAAEQIPGFDLYLSFTGGPTLTWLERAYAARRAAALYCSAEVEPPSAGAALRWDLSYLGTYSADRQPALEALLLQVARAAPHLRFAVAGAQYPQAIDWPTNVARFEHVAPDAHGAFYAASRFTLNLTRADMRRAGHSPSVRLFEAAARATPVITDTWPGLAEFFTPGDEILVVGSGAEVSRILRETSEAERLAIGAAARARVLASHTAAHRAAQLETLLLAAGAAGRRAAAPHPRPWPQAVAAAP